METETKTKAGIGLFQNEFKDLGELKNAKLINNRRIINGNDDGLMQIHPLKHPFGFEYYEEMVKNTWTLSEINAAKDIAQWKGSIISDDQKHAYRLMMASALTRSGMQANRMANQLIRPVKSPEVVLGLVRHAFEKAMHVHNMSMYVNQLGIDIEALYELAKDNDYIKSRNRKLYQLYT